MNNSGKTSFLKALSYAFGNSSRTILRDELFIDKHGGNPSTEINIDIYIEPLGDEFDDMWSLSFGSDIQRTSSGKEFFAFRTQISFSDLSDLPKLERFSIKDWLSPLEPTDSLKANISGLQYYFMDARRDLLDELNNSSSYIGRMTRMIKYDDSTIKAIEDQLSELNSEVVKHSAILDYLRTKLSELNKTVNAHGNGVEISPLPSKLRDIHKGLKIQFQDGSSDTFSLEYHGMGTRSWASILSFKAFTSWEKDFKSNEFEPFHPILALEEPEAHLHPNAQRHVYSQIESIEGQKIISTHSPYIMTQSRLSGIRLFYKDSDETEIYKIDSGNYNEEEIQRLSTDILVSKGELLFSRKVILVEGITEEIVLPIVAKNYLGCSLYEKGVSVVYIQGDNFRPYIQLLHELKIPWIIFSDYDNESVCKKLDNALSSFGIDPSKNHNNIIKLGHKIESYLVSEGFVNEIVSGIIEYNKRKLSHLDHRALIAKENKIKSLSPVDIEKEIIANKTIYAPFYSIFLGRLPKNLYPNAFKQLFDQI